MADQNNLNSNEQQHDLNLPKVLIHGPQGFSSVLQPPFSQNFHILNHSSLPLHQFLATHTHHCSSVAALLCDGGYPVTADVLRLLPSLRLVVTASAGTEHVDLDESRRRGVRVAGAGNMFSEDVADLAVALLIDVVMKISAADRCLRKRVPLGSTGFPLASKLAGKKVGIVGLGKIGLEVAQRLEALDCIISYNSRTQKPLVWYPFYSSVVELASNNQVIILWEIGGAGLDVFQNEPLVCQQFFGLDNVVLSPHAGFSTSESYLGICQLVGRNLEAFFSNNTLITPVI
uniref:Glyoxylate reductase n=1 Tax=Cajanus cajan TaxID=3821 RepID=A0A151UCD9_CAJCA|nr:Glyoxylate reductase [Cajanus cajan]